MAWTWSSRNKGQSCQSAALHAANVAHTGLVGVCLAVPFAVAVIQWTPWAAVVAAAHQIWKFLMNFPSRLCFPLMA